MTETAMPLRRLLLVTGMSGAGKSSVLRILEDLGWEVVDNVPLLLLDALVGLDPKGRGAQAPLAIGIDTRTRGFEPELVLRHLMRLREQTAQSARLCFLDADADILQRRFTETRRRHPLARDRTVMDGIRLEREWLAGLRENASQLIDTSDLSLPQLRELLQSKFGMEDGMGLQVLVQSFSFRQGLPRDADLVIDVRFLRNPYYDADLRHRTGREAAVQTHIQEDPDWPEFERRTSEFLTFLTPRYGREGKSYLTIAFGCTGGRHRSVFSAEHFGAKLRATGQPVTVRHRDVGE